MTDYAKTKIKDLIKAMEPEELEIVKEALEELENEQYKGSEELEIVKEALEELENEQSKTT